MTAQMSMRTTAGHEIAASEIFLGDRREEDPGGGLGDEDPSDDDHGAWDRQEEYLRAHGSPEFWTWWTARNSKDKDAKIAYLEKIRLHLPEACKLQNNYALSTKVSSNDDAARAIAGKAIAVNSNVVAAFDQAGFRIGDVPKGIEVNSGADKAALDQAAV